MTKICCICKSEKTLDKFYKHKSSKYGYTSQCGECNRAIGKAARDQRKNDPTYIEQKKKRAQRWYQKNKMELRLYARTRKWQHKARQPLDHIRRCTSDRLNTTTAKMLGCSTDSAYNYLTQSGSLDLSDYHIDHIVPLSFIYKIGGLDLVQASGSHIRNLQLLPPKDNSLKSNSVHTEAQYKILKGWGYDLSVIGEDRDAITIQSD